MALVAALGGLVGEQPRRGDVGGHLAQPVADRLATGDRRAEGAALARVGHRVVERGLGQADAHPGQRHPLGLEALHDLRKAPPLLSEDAIPGHPHVLQNELTGIGGVPAHLLQRGPERQTRRVALHDEGGDALVPGATVLAARGDDQDVRQPRVGDEHLGAAEQPVLAVGARPALHPGHVGPRAGLGDGDRGDRLTAQHRLQEAPALLGGAEAREMRGRPCTR